MVFVTVLLKQLSNGPNIGNITAKSIGHSIPTVLLTVFLKVPRLVTVLSLTIANTTGHSIANNIAEYS